MNFNEMRANEDALGEETATTAWSLKFSPVLSRNWTWIFSKTMMDKAKRSSPMKIQFQDKDFEWFSARVEN